MQPKKNSYRFYKQEFVFNRMVDTNIVYLTENMVVTSDRNGKIVSKEHLAYGFIVFSSNGIMFLSKLNLTSKPQNNKINTIHSGQYCFYKLNDSKIIIEYYRFDLKLFEFWFGEIQPSGDIYFYKAKGRPFGTYSEKISYLFKKTDIKFAEPLKFPE